MATIGIWGIAVAVMLVGIAIAAVGFSDQFRSDRTNEEDVSSWLTWAVGMSIFGVGLAIPTRRPLLMLLFGIGAAPLGYSILVALFWGTIFIHAIWCELGFASFL